MKQINDANTLNRMYEEACAADKPLFAEMRTNVRLRNGDHYNNATKKVVGDLRRKGVVSKDQKIRITKNHIHRVTNEYINAILSRNPSVQAAPFNDGADFHCNVLGQIYLRFSLRQTLQLIAHKPSFQ